MSVAYSAPGKAFLFGGYLVLDSKYSAYVIALSARIHSVVRNDTIKKSEFPLVTIESSQFKNGKWTYKLIKNQNGYISAEEINSHNNPFLAFSLSIFFSYIFSDQNPIPSNFEPLKISIFSHKAFHSNPIHKSNDGKDKDFIFPSYSTTISETPKTGLGSSAALVTSIIASLVEFYSITSEKLDQKSLIHNLAQIAHSAAQGKIGSGFDIATAVYGSITYNRFYSGLIDQLTSQNVQNLPNNYNTLLRNTVNQSWGEVTSYKFSRISLPFGITLMLGDVTGGSETPKLVSKVLDWREKNHDMAYKLWEDINDKNIKVVNILKTLNKLYNEKSNYYQKAFKELSVISLGDSNKRIFNNDVLDYYKLIYELADLIIEIRKNLRIMSEKSQVPIEPPSQTSVIDFYSSIPGVIGGVVPGAGGYDAICLLVLNDAVPNVLNTKYNDKKYNTKVSWLDVHQESDGLIKEDISLYSRFL